MATSTPNYAVARFSTAALPEQRRGRAMDELHERGLLGFKFAPYGEALPHVDFVNRSMPGSVSLRRPMLVSAARPCRTRPASKVAAISIFA